MTTMTQEDFLSRGGDQRIKRDGYGRPLVIPPEGGKAVGYTRCTTFVDCMDDRNNLEKWKMRSVAIGLSLRPDLLLRVSSIGPDEPDEADDAKVWKAQHNEAAKAALEAAKSSAKATIGSSLHTYTEKIDRGQPVGPVPADYVRHLKAYEEATKGLTARHIEQFTVQDDLRIGGTPDRIVELDGHDGLYIADVKSGSVAYPHKMAMQLAVYAHSLLYNPVTGERTNPGAVSTERGIIIALDQKTGECQLHWIDLARAWEAVQVAAQVHAWRKTKDLVKPLLSVVPDQVAAAPLVEATAQSVTNLDGLRVNVQQPPPKWTGVVADGPARLPEQAGGPPNDAQTADDLAREKMQRERDAVQAAGFGFPLTAPEVAAALQVADVTDRATLVAVKVAITKAETPEQLVILWQAATARGCWSDEFTNLAAARKRELAA